MLEYEIVFYTRSLTDSLEDVKSFINEKGLLDKLSHYGTIDLTLKKGNAWGENQYRITATFTFKPHGFELEWCLDDHVPYKEYDESKDMLVYTMVTHNAINFIKHVRESIEKALSNTPDKKTLVPVLLTCGDVYKDPKDIIESSTVFIFEDDATTLLAIFKEHGIEEGCIKQFYPDGSRANDNRVKGGKVHPGKASISPFDNVPNWVFMDYLEHKAE